MMHAEGGGEGHYSEVGGGGRGLLRGGGDMRLRGGGRGCKGGWVAPKVAPDIV